MIRRAFTTDVAAAICLGLAVGVGTLAIVAVLAGWFL